MMSKLISSIGKLAGVAEIKSKGDAAKRKQLLNGASAFLRGQTADISRLGR